MVKLVISYGGHIDNNIKCLIMRYKKHDVKPSKEGVGLRGCGLY